MYNYFEKYVVDSFKDIQWLYLFKEAYIHFHFQISYQ